MECWGRSYERLFHSKDDQQHNTNGTSIRSTHARSSAKLRPVQRTRTKKPKGDIALFNSKLKQPSRRNQVPNNPTRNKTRQLAQLVNTNKVLCWRCGGMFIPGNINQCTAKQAQGSICEKTSHFAKIPPIPLRRHQQRGGYQRPLGQNQSQIRVRQNQENLIEEGQNDQAKTEFVDP